MALAGLLLMAGLGDMGSAFTLRRPPWPPPSAGCCGELDEMLSWGIMCGGPFCCCCCWWLLHCCCMVVAAARLRSEKSWPEKGEE